MNKIKSLFYETHKLTFLNSVKVYFIIYKKCIKKLKCLTKHNIVSNKFFSKISKRTIFIQVSLNLSFIKNM